MYTEIEKIEPKEIVKGFKGKFIHTEKMTLAFWDVTAGASISLHHHVHEQTCHVLEGKFELTVNGIRKVYEPVFVAIIPSGTPHSGTAITHCKLMDVFSPVREDYK